MQQEERARREGEGAEVLDEVAQPGFSDLSPGDAAQLVAAARIRRQQGADGQAS